MKILHTIATVAGLATGAGAMLVALYSPPAQAEISCYEQDCIYLSASDSYWCPPTLGTGTMCEWAGWNCYNDPCGSWNGPGATPTIPSDKMTQCWEDSTGQRICKFEPRRDDPFWCYFQPDGWIFMCTPHDPGGGPT